MVRRFVGTGPLKTTKSYKSCQTSFALPRSQLESAMGGEVERSTSRKDVEGATGMFATGHGNG